MKKNRIFNYILALLIPCFLMLLLYICVGIYPFGNKSILTVDMQDQYVEFFNAFKNIIQNGNSIFYSFSKTLGGNMFGLISYYLLSPFNLILLFFDKINVVDAIFLINVLKIGFCGLTSYIYFSKTFNKKTRVSVLFSIVYALTAYNIVYSQNIMWLDGVIWLPIVFLGIDKLIDKRPLLFYISLTISVFSNYYIGYMTCIASLIYFIYKLYINNGYEFSLKGNKKEIIYFFKYALLSVGTVAVIIIPSIFSLLAGKVDGDLTELIPKQTYAFLDILPKFYLGSFKNSDLSGGTPNVYVSVIMILLIFLFLSNKKINQKEKKATLIVLGIFMLSFVFYPFDIIWHTFQHPVGFAYRYSFIFDFLLLIIAYKSYINLDEIDKKLLTKFLGIAFIITMFVDKFVYTSSSFYKIIGTFILLLIYSIYIYYKKNKNLNIFITILIIIEMFINGMLIVFNINYSQRKEYVEFVDSYGTIVDNVKENDKSFYRMDKEISYSTNDPLLLNYNGLSHFSSTYEGINNELLGDYLGIFNRFYITNYLGSTLVTNSLFNVKYVMVERILPYYDMVDSYKGVNLYENNYYLPFMFMVNEDIKNLKLEKLQAFNNQNEILNYMTNTEDNVFVSNVVDVELNNLKLNKDIEKYKQYDKIINSNPAFINFKITVQNDGILYAYVSSDYNKKVDIVLDGEQLIDTSNQNNFRYNILELGDYKKGDIVELKFILLEDSLKISDYQFYTLDEKKFKEKINVLNNNQLFELVEYKGNYIKGTINVIENNQILYTSIPVDKGWHVYIDGVEAKYDVLLNTFIGVTLDVGEHTIEFEYISQGFETGLMISIVSLAIFAYLIYYENKSKNKNDK